MSGVEIILKDKIEESIQLFYKMYNEFISRKTKLDLDFHNHFYETRLHLDMHREKIYKIYMETIDKTKEFEEKNNYRI